MALERGSPEATPWSKEAAATHTQVNTTNSRDKGCVDPDEPAVSHKMCQPLLPVIAAWAPAANNVVASKTRETFAAAMVGRLLDLQARARRRPEHALSTYRKARGINDAYVFPTSKLHTVVLRNGC
jgi:hypothetical protein